MNLSLIDWRVRFALSRLWMPIEPIVYDSKFNPGDVTDYYERYLVTREIKGYRLWHISFFVFDSLKIKKLYLFSDKAFAVEIAKAGKDNKYYYFKKNMKNLDDYPIHLSFIKLTILRTISVLLGVAVVTLFENYYYTTALSIKPAVIHLSHRAVNKFIKDCTTEKQSYRWNLPLPLPNSPPASKNSCDRTLE